MRLPRRSLPQNAPLALGGDPLRTLETLFQTTFGAVRRSLARLGVPSRDQRDLAQDVFLAAYLNLPRYDPKRAPMQAWLHGITVNLASHYRDKAQNRREVLVPEPCCSAALDDPSADEQLISREGGLLVQEVLGRIDPKLRHVMIAHDIEGVAMAEIAASLAIPTSTAYKWLYRARRAFRAAFERRLRREHTSGALERPPDGVYNAREHATPAHRTGAEHGQPEAIDARLEAPPSCAFALVGVWFACLSPRAPDRAPIGGAPKGPRPYAIRARQQHAELSLEPSFACRPE